MDTDSCIRFVIFFIGNLIISFITRLLRTSVMCSEFTDNKEENFITTQKRELSIMSLELMYGILRISYIIALVLLLQKLYYNLEISFLFKMIILAIIFGGSFLVYDIVTIDFPDRIGSVNPNKTLYNLRVILYFFTAIAAPLYKIISIIKKFVISFLSLPDLKPRVTLDQIYSMVELGEEQGIINSAEREMIDGVMGFNTRVAEEIMTPRTEVFMIDINKDPKEYMDDLAEYRYSRIPVYEDDIDNIVGVIYLKDIFKVVYKEGIKNLDIKKLIKPAYFVPERKNVHILFQEMQREHRHLSVLMDEYGGFSGIVTMEDLTEEIMGDIDDEFDNDEPDVYALTTNEAVVQGSTSIKDINDMLGTNFPEDMDYDTISGFIINKLGFIPNSNRVAEIDYENANLKILEVEDRRIKKVKITLTDIEKNSTKKNDGHDEK